MSPTTTSILIAIVTGVMGGGLITAGVSLYRAKKTATAERDNIIVTGAETAVLALQKTLTAETARADRAEKKNEELREEMRQKEQRIAQLENKLDTIQSALDEARDELHAFVMGSRPERS